MTRHLPVCFNSLSVVVFQPVNPVFLFVFAVVGCLWSVVCYMKYRWRREEEETRQMYDMVERIIGKEHLLMLSALPTPHIYTHTHNFAFSVANCGKLCGKLS